MAPSLENLEVFGRTGWIGAFLVMGGVGFYLFATAPGDLPVGIAYAVWTSIGAAGTAALDIVLLGNSANS